MSKVPGQVGVLSKIGKLVNKTLHDVGVLSKDTTELSADTTELMMDATLKDGKKIYFEDESKAAGSMVYLMGDDGMKLPLPVGTYELKDGTPLVVSEEGKVGAEAAPAPETESMEEEMPKEETPADETEMEEAPKEEVDETEMEEVPMKEESTTELEEGVKAMTDEAIAMMVEKAVIAKLKELGIMPETEMEEEMPEEETEMGYTGAMKPEDEEMSKDNGEVEEFKHSPSKGTGGKVDTTWKPKNNIGQRQNITDTLRNWKD